MMSGMFGSSVRLYWPGDLMDETVAFSAPSKDTWIPIAAADPGATGPLSNHRNHPAMQDTVTKKARTWCAGRRGSCYVGVYCSQATYMVRDDDCKDACVKAYADAPSVCISVRACMRFAFPVGPCFPQ
jgi:hypothetical protein